MKFEDFLKHGYCEYKAHKAHRMCQKTFRDQWELEGIKKLYFINVYEWDHTQYGAPRGIEVEVEFYKGENEWFTVTLHNCEEKTLSDIEGFFHSIFETMRCVPDIHNN